MADKEYPRYSELRKMIYRAMESGLEDVAAYSRIARAMEDPTLRNLVLSMMADEYGHVRTWVALCYMYGQDGKYYSEEKAKELRPPYWEEKPPYWDERPPYWDDCPDWQRPPCWEDRPPYWNDCPPDWDGPPYWNENPPYEERPPYWDDRPPYYDQYPNMNEGSSRKESADYPKAYRNKL